MNDKFGGVSVDEETLKSDKFGGIPVEDDKSEIMPPVKSRAISTTAGGPPLHVPSASVKDIAGEVWNALNGVNISTGDQMPLIRHTSDKSNKDVAKEFGPVGEGVMAIGNIASDVVNSLVTPIGMTMGVGGRAGKALAGMFAAQGLANAKDAAQHAGTVVGDPNATLQDKIEAVGGMGVNAAMTALPGIHAATGWKTSMGTPTPEQLQAVANAADVLPEASKAAAEVLQKNASDQAKKVADLLDKSEMATTESPVIPKVELGQRSPGPNMVTPTPEQTAEIQNGFEATDAVRGETGAEVEGLPTSHLSPEAESALSEQLKTGIQNVAPEPSKPNLAKVTAKNGEVSATSQLSGSGDDVIPTGETARRLGLDTPAAPGPGAMSKNEPPYPAISQLTDSLKATQPFGEKESLSARDKIADAWANGKTVTERAIAMARSLSETIKDTARGVRAVTNLDRLYGVFDWNVQSSAGRSAQAARAMRAQVKSQTDREASAIWIDTPGYDATKQATIKAALAALPADTKASVRRAVERAANLPPELRQFAEGLKQFFGLREQDAVSHEIFEHGLSDYFTHVWKKESNMPDSVRAAISNGRVNDYFQFARKRKIGMFLEGILAGKTPMLDPADVVPLYNFSMDRSIASRQLIRSMADGIEADGRPTLMPTGTAVKADRGGTPLGLIIDPKQKKHNGMGYKTVDHPALRKWKWAGEDENGNPVLYRSDLAVHPDAYERVARLMDRGRLTPTRWGKAALQVSTEVKSFKLNGILSMFHQVHVGSHALFHWTIPFSFKDPELFQPDGQINWDSPTVRFAVEKMHLKIAPDPHELTAFAEGMMPTGLVSKIPFLGPLNKAYSEYLFTRYIPNIKLKTAKEAWQRAQRMQANGLFKGVTIEQLAARTGDSVNNAFGELNQLFLGKSGRDPRFQRILRGIFLAPDFGEARLRFVEKAVTRHGNEERLALATMFMTLYVGARIANKLTHDDPEMDMKHAFEVKTGGHWISMRSVLGDVNHAVNDFGQFAYVRLNPLYARTLSDWLFSRDPQGHKLTWTQKALTRPLEQLVPIQLGALTRDDQKLWESFITAAGLQVRKDRPQQDVGQLVKDWMKKSNDPKMAERLAALEQQVFPVSPYSKLRYALRENEPQAAAKAIAELRAAKHTPAQIRQALIPRKPFTGSWANEAKFKASLDPAQRKLYDQAMEERVQLFRRYNSLSRLTP